MITPGKNRVNGPMQLSINLQTDAGTDVDPTTVTFRLMSPSGVETSYTYGTDSEITKSSVGDYDVIFTPDMAGRWHYRWQTTGTGTQVVEEGDFLVQYSRFYDDVWDTGYSL